MFERGSTRNIPGISVPDAAIEGDQDHGRSTGGAPIFNAACGTSTSGPVHCPNHDLVILFTVVQRPQNQYLAVYEPKKLSIVSS